MRIEITIEHIEWRYLSLRIALLDHEATRFISFIYNILLFITGLPVEFNETMNLLSNHFQQVNVIIQNLEGKLNKALYIQVEFKLFLQFLIYFIFAVYLHIF